jgi:thiosulfate/3-mercaptopyruvate sulfurtransferase
MKRSNWLNAAAAAIIVVGLMLSGPAIAGEKYKGFERGDALITPAELKALKDANDPKLVLIGVVKGGLTGSFTMGHISGAYGVWRPDYTAKAGDEYPFGGMRMNQEAFQAFARSLGVDDDSKVVIYDEKYDATRLWWMFYMYGKTDVRILDGGYEAWKAADYDTEMGGGVDKGTKEGNFTAKAATPGMVWEMNKIAEAKECETTQLWDTREPDEWSGGGDSGRHRQVRHRQGEGSGVLLPVRRAHHHPHLLPVSHGLGHGEAAQLRWLLDRVELQQGQSGNSGRIGSLII